MLQIQCRQQVSTIHVRERQQHRVRQRLRQWRQHSQRRNLCLQGRQEGVASCCHAGSTLHRSVNGEFDRDYQQNAGSYYDKVYAPYLMTESVDNFVSDSYTDFIDPRYRAVSMADLFPDGYRRRSAKALILP